MSFYTQGCLFGYNSDPNFSYVKSVQPLRNCPIFMGTRNWEMTFSGIEITCQSRVLDSLKFSQISDFANKFPRNRYRNRNVCIYTRLWTCIIHHRSAYYCYVVRLLCQLLWCIADWPPTMQMKQWWCQSQSCQSSVLFIRGVCDHNSFPNQQFAHHKIINRQGKCTFLHLLIDGRKYLRCVSMFLFCMIHRLEVNVLREG